MSFKIKKTTNPRLVGRIKRKKRVRKNIVGTAEIPRFSFFKGSKAFYVQFVDDIKGHTVLGISSSSKKHRGMYKINKDGAKKFAEYVASVATEKGISRIVFDRNGYKYHGILKDFADTLRDKGLKF